MVIDDFNLTIFNFKIEKKSSLEQEASSHF